MYVDVHSNLYGSCKSAVLHATDNGHLTPADWLPLDHPFSAAHWWFHRLEGTEAEMRTLVGALDKCVALMESGKHPIRSRGKAAVKEAIAHLREVGLMVREKIIEEMVKRLVPTLRERDTELRAEKAARDAAARAAGLDPYYV